MHIFLAFSLHPINPFTRADSCCSFLPISQPKGGDAKNMCGVIDFPSVFVLGSFVYL